jgi:hypothetical protein
MQILLSLQRYIIFIIPTYDFRKVHYSNIGECTSKIEKYEAIRLRSTNQKDRAVHTIKIGKYISRIGKYKFLV